MTIITSVNIRQTGYINTVSLIRFRIHIRFKARFEGVIRLDLF